jgi:hypothetical protein
VDTPGGPDLRVPGRRRRFIEGPNAEGPTKGRRPDLRVPGRRRHRRERNAARARARGERRGGLEGVAGRVGVAQLLELGLFVFGLARRAPFSARRGRAVASASLQCAACSAAGGFAGHQRTGTEVGAAGTPEPPSKVLAASGRKGGGGTTLLRSRKFSSRAREASTPGLAVASALRAPKTEPAVFSDRSVWRATMCWHTVV